MIPPTLPETAPISALSGEAFVLLTGERWKLRLDSDGDICAVDESDPTSRFRILEASLLAGRVATLGDVVRLAQVELEPRDPLVWQIVVKLLRGEVLLGENLSAGRIDGALDPEIARFGCYQDPGGNLLIGWHLVPTIEERSWGYDCDDVAQDDASPFGAAMLFVNTLGITRTKEALRRAEERA